MKRAAGEIGLGEKEGLNFARQIKCAVLRQRLSHSVPASSASSRPAPVSPKGMFKENPVARLCAPRAPVEDARLFARLRRQHFCLPPKMCPINREKWAKEERSERERGERHPSRVITSEDPADCFEEIQSPFRRRGFHSFPDLFRCTRAARKRERLGYGTLSYRCCLGYNLTNHRGLFVRDPIARKGRPTVGLPAGRSADRSIDRSIEAHLR